MTQIFVIQNDFKSAYNHNNLRHQRSVLNRDF